MDAVIPILLVAGGLAATFGAFQFARRFGLWAGLVIPGLAAAGWVYRSSMPLGHAEEAMGRGIEMVVLWLPLVALTAIAALIGLAVRGSAK
jgi:Na+/melibiose symporter-like transporter